MTRKWAGDRRPRNTFAERSEEYYAISPCQILILLPCYRDCDLDEDDDVKQEYECHWQKEWPEHGLLHTEILILIQCCKPTTFNIRRDHFKSSVRHIIQNTKTKENYIPLFIRKDLTGLPRSFYSIMLLFLWGMQSDLQTNFTRNCVVRWNITNKVSVHQM